MRSHRHGPHPCAPERGRRLPPTGYHVRRFIAARLHRRLFLLMGLAIFITFLIAGTAAHFVSPGASPWHRQRDLEAFASHRFAEVWADSWRRTALTRDVTSTFGVRLTLKDPQGQVLDAPSGLCRTARLILPVVAERSNGRAGELLGQVELCGGPLEPGSRFRFFWILFASSVALWLAAGVIARRLGRPLWQLAEVTTRIGAGDLAARVRLGRHERGEVGMLAHSINHMAERLEKQMSDQRQLLAGVSHEIRTPLARLRVIMELLRGKTEAERLLGEAEREVLEIDDLTSRLLASSRLEFVALEKKPLDGAALCREALRRLNLEETLLHQEAPHATFVGDATLVSRALLNILHNAATHGQNVTGVWLGELEDQLVFRITDAGPGISETDLQRVFAPFVQGAPHGAKAGSGSLGLGLALVKRIAEAHGGSVRTGRSLDFEFFVELRLPRHA